MVAIGHVSIVHANQAFLKGLSEAIGLVRWATGLAQLPYKPMEWIRGDILIEELSPGTTGTYPFDRDLRLEQGKRMGIGVPASASRTKVSVTFHVYGDPEQPFTLSVFLVYVHNGWWPYFYMSHGTYKGVEFSQEQIPHGYSGWNPNLFTRTRELPRNGELIRGKIFVFPFQPPEV